MSKPRNQIKSEPLYITTTPQVRALLERLVESGLYGKNPTEAAERLIARGLEERIGAGFLERKSSRRRKLAKSPGN